MIKSTFNISRDKGTKRTLAALTELTKLEPSIWKSELLDLIKPADSDDEIVVKLVEQISITDKPYEI